MAIVQKDPTQQNAAVTVNQADPAKIEVASFAYPGGDSAPASVDATTLQGGPLRVYLAADGHISTELYRDHYWLLAEAILPERWVENQPTGQLDEHGQAIMQMVERPLDLGQVDIVVYPLPEVIE